jgi:hypothetical protein
VQKTMQFGPYRGFRVVSATGITVLIAFAAMLFSVAPASASVGITVTPNPVPYTASCDTAGGQVPLHGQTTCGAGSDAGDWITVTSSGGELNPDDNTLRIMECAQQVLKTHSLNQCDPLTAQTDDAVTKKQYTSDSSGNLTGVYSFNALPTDATGFDPLSSIAVNGTNEGVLWIGDDFTDAFADGILSAKIPLSGQPPAVTAIAPTSGSTAGGTTVTITGAAFTGATSVLFGSVAATSFKVVSATEITAVSPAQAAAEHNIVITTPSGTSAHVAADEFTYLAAPAVTAISPKSGPTTGGTTVTVTGTAFTGATKVAVGAVAATNFKVVSATEITAVSPAQAAAEHNIVVTTPSGTSPDVAADEFTYLAAPAVTAISPKSGPTTGGTTVTITGTAFTGATKVAFGAVAATNFKVVSATEITAVSPAQAAAEHNIVVTTPSGTSPDVAADEFTYT